MGFPKEHVFGGACKAKSAYTDEGGQLVQGWSDSIYKVNHGDKRASFDTGPF